MRNTFIVILALACAPLLAGCDGKSDTPPPVRPVLSMVVTPQSGATGGFAGTVEPRYRANLGFRVLGRVIARDVNVGDLVTKGTRLAALDPIALDLAVEASRADLANATAQLENATSTEKRQRILLGQANVSPEQFESVEQARQAAEAAVTRARTNLDKALEQRGYAELRAEFDGVVTAVDTEVGQIVPPGQTVATVARPDIREAVVDVPADVSAALREGSPFQVSLQIAPAVRVNGRVREIAPQVDAMTHTRRVKISLDDPPASFRLGTTITAYLPAPVEQQIRLPASALFERDGKILVWVVDPAAKTVSVREVHIGGRDEQLVSIVSGLETGARVVTAGVNSLAAGQSVKFSEEAPTQ